MSIDKNATQSTTFAASTWYASRYEAGNAVDRDTTTCMRTEIIGENSPDKTVWWEVDLGRVYNIHSVDILFKNYDGFGIVLPIYKYDTCTHKIDAYSINLLGHYFKDRSYIDYIVLIWKMEICIHVNIRI